MIDERTAGVLTQLVNTDVVVLLAVALVLALLGGFAILWRAINAQHKMATSVMDMAKSVQTIATSVAKDIEADAAQTAILTRITTGVTEQNGAVKGLRSDISALTVTQTRLIATLKPIALTLRGLDAQIEEIKAVGGSISETADLIRVHVSDIKRIVIAAAKHADMQPFVADGDTEQIKPLIEEK